MHTDSTVEKRQAQAEAVVAALSQWTDAGTTAKSNGELIYVAANLNSIYVWLHDSGGITIACNGSNGTAQIVQVLDEVAVALRSVEMAAANV